MQINLGGPELSGSGGGTVPDDAVTLKFENFALNVVTLTIDVTGTSEKVKQILFNVDPSITGLSFLDVSGPTAEKSFDANEMKLNGAPLTGFDIEFLFDPRGLHGALWHGSALAVFRITMTGGTQLTENSFSFTNPYSQFGAVQILCPNGSGDSGKYGSTGVVPEPTTFAVWSTLGLMGAVFVFKSRRKSA